MIRESVILRDVAFCLSHFSFYVVPQNTRCGGAGWSVWKEIKPDQYVGVIWRQNVGGARLGRSFVKFGIPGESDFSGWLFGSGKRVSIEVKGPKGDLTVDQFHHDQLSRQTGVLAGVVRSYADTETLLRSWGLVRPADRVLGAGVK